ncbi:hypothetical protein HDU96_009695 [Phlyctochytrium bullatum]|nr:hypothetical protein HDU96_009695 [Phlyctochytrium bullatum]
MEVGDTSIIMAGDDDEMEYQASRQRLAATPATGQQPSGSPHPSPSQWRRRDSKHPGDASPPLLPQQPGTASVSRPIPPRLGNLAIPRRTNSVALNPSDPISPMSAAPTTANPFFRPKPVRSSSTISVPSRPVDGSSPPFLPSLLRRPTLPKPLDTAPSRLNMSSTWLDGPASMSPTSEDPPPNFLTVTTADPSPPPTPSQRHPFPFLAGPPQRRNTTTSNAQTIQPHPPPPQGTDDAKGPLSPAASPPNDNQLLGRWLDAGGLHKDPDSMTLRSRLSRLSGNSLRPPSALTNGRPDSRTGAESRTSREDRISLNRPASTNAAGLADPAFPPQQHHLDDLDDFGAIGPRGTRTAYFAMDDLEGKDGDDYGRYQPPLDIVDVPDVPASALESDSVVDLPNRPQWMCELSTIMHDRKGSKIGRIVNTFFLAVLLVSIVSFCLGTMEAFVYNPTWRVAIFVVDSTCVIIFTIEYILRVLVAETWSELYHPLMIIDLLSILPFYIEIAIVTRQGTDVITGLTTMEGVSALRVLRLVRTFRILKFIRKSSKLAIILQAVRASVDGIAVLFVTIAILIVFYSSLMYYAEQAVMTFNEDRQWVYRDGTRSPYQSIPDCFYFLVGSLTGNPPDIPQSPYSKLVIAFCMMTSVFVLAFPLTIITISYSKTIRAFTQAQKQKRERRERERAERMALLEERANARMFAELERERLEDEREAAEAGGAGAGTAGSPFSAKVLAARWRARFGVGKRKTVEEPLGMEAEGAGGWEEGQEKEGPGEKGKEVDGEVEEAANGEDPGSSGGKTSSETTLQTPPAPIEIPRIVETAHLTPSTGEHPPLARLSVEEGEASQGAVALAAEKSLESSSKLTVSQPSGDDYVSGRFGDPRASPLPEAVAGTGNTAGGEVAAAITPTIPATAKSAKPAYDLVVASVKALGTQSPNPSAVAGRKFALPVPGGILSPPRSGPTSPKGGVTPVKTPAHIVTGSGTAGKGAANAAGQPKSVAKTATASVGVIHAVAALKKPLKKGKGATTVGKAAPTASGGSGGPQGKAAGSAGSPAPPGSGPGLPSGAMSSTLPMSFFSAAKPPGNGAGAPAAPGLIAKTSGQNVNVPELFATMAPLLPAGRAAPKDVELRIVDWSYIRPAPPPPQPDEESEDGSDSDDDSDDDLEGSDDDGSDDDGLDDSDDATNDDDDGDSDDDDRSDEDSDSATRTTVSSTGGGVGSRGRFKGLKGVVVATPARKKRKGKKKKKKGKGKGKKTGEAAAGGALAARAGTAAPAFVVPPDAPDRLSMRIVVRDAEHYRRIMKALAEIS